jgi:hypothetical protein
MKVPLRYIIALALVMSTNSCKIWDLKQDMVHFDRAFIPVWIYVREGDMAKAKAAVFNLEFRWQQLRGKYQNTVEEDNWQEAFRRVDDWLGDVYYAIDANQPQLALNQLDHVRYDLQQLRRHYHIDYYLDHLFDFHDELTVLIEAANDNMLCLLEWPEFEELSVSALQHWRNLMTHPFDAGLYEFTVEEESLFLTYQKEMEEVLVSFSEIVETADREAIASESGNLELTLRDVMRLFGNFDASRTHYAGM